MTDLQTKASSDGQEAKRERILSRLNKAFVEHVSLEEVSGDIMEAICQEFGLDRAAIIVESDLGILSYTQACTEQVHADAVTLIKTAGQVLCVYDFMEDGPPRELLNKHGFRLGTPLMLKKLNLAALFLGRKNSGEPFDIEDVQFFDDITTEISTGIENAEAYNLLKTMLMEFERWNDEWSEETRRLKERDSQKRQELARLKSALEATVTEQFRVPAEAMRGLLKSSGSKDENLLNGIQQNLVIIEEGSTRVNQLINDVVSAANADDIHFELPAVMPRDHTSALERMLEEIVRSWKVQSHKV